MIWNSNSSMQVKSRSLSKICCATRTILQQFWRKHTEGSTSKFSRPTSLPMRSTIDSWIWILHLAESSPTHCFLWTCRIFQSQCVKPWKKVRFRLAGYSESMFASDVCNLKPAGRLVRALTKQFYRIRSQALTPELSWSCAMALRQRRSSRSLFRSWKRLPQGLKMVFLWSVRVHAEHLLRIMFNCTFYVIHSTRLNHSMFEYGKIWWYQIVPMTYTIFFIGSNILSGASDSRLSKQQDGWN